MEATNAWEPLPYRRLWPLFVLLTAEVFILVAFAVLPGFGPSLQATPLSAIVAGVILLSGLLPALLRPSLETLMAGCLATLMAAVLVTPIEAGDVDVKFMGATVACVFPPYLILRLVNSSGLGPLVFHLAARFQMRRKVSVRLLSAVYVASFGLVSVFAFTRLVPVRVISIILFMGVELGSLVGAAGLLLIASREGDFQDRRIAQQARLLFIGLILAETPALLRPIGLLLGVEIIPYDLFLVAQILVPLSLAYAVLRHDLFGIDRVLRRGLAYTLLSLLILALYFGLTLGLTAALANTWPHFRGLAVVLGVFLAALAFDPCRRWLQYWIDRFLYPDRLNFLRAVTDIREALARVVSRAEAIHLLTETLPPRLGAEWASLTLAPEPDVLVRRDGQPAWNARLIVGGRSLGRYWLGPRCAGPAYDADERAQLESLASQAALALAYTDTIEALRELNRELEQRVLQRTAQIVDQQRDLAVYEERQRMARELHDSVSQSLFSINLSARALRGLVHNDPEAAVSGLRELEGAARNSLAEMRALLAQLRAPQTEASEAGVIFDLTGNDARCDLVVGLASYCEQLRLEIGPDGRPPLLDVELDMPRGLLLPERLYHQVIQVAREALHNVIKHAGVRQALCELRHDPAWMTLVISDQGCGFEPGDSTAGYGLRGMCERVEALGGKIEVISNSGAGARLRIDIPLQEVKP